MRVICYVERVRADVDTCWQVKARRRVMRARAGCKNPRQPPSSPFLPLLPAPKSSMSKEVFMMLSSLLREILPNFIFIVIFSFLFHCFLPEMLRPRRR